MASTMQISNCTVGNSLRATASKATGSGYGITSASTLQDQIAWTKNVSLTNGTADNNANLAFHYSGSIAPSGEILLDLTGGTNGTPDVLDPFGVAAVFASLKSIQISNNADTYACTLQVGGATANAIASPFASTTDIVSVPNGGQFVLTAPKSGFTVATDSADILKIANTHTANTATVEILILGVSQ